MDKLSLDEIRRRFEFASEFNDLFDAFEQAIGQELDDIDLYKKLFWNKSLSSDGVALFAEQLAKRFPYLAYNTFLWLGEMYALTVAADDNFDRALMYYRKASAANPKAIEPYLNAVSCYDPDVKIPPAQVLIEFLKTGVEHVPDNRIICKRLSYLYAQLGNDEMTQYYKRLGDE